MVKAGKYQAEILVFEVKKDSKFPDGIKAKYLLKDIELNSARLLVDNHAPYGFHMHTELPGNHESRTELKVSNYMEALDLFFEEVGRILKNEEN